ncbi:MAG: uracil-DNA glycosylase family protein [Porticoccaceae bacterium]|jgi:uracil-DNA glycosylase
MNTESLNGLVTEVRACTICEPHLPNGVRPVLQVNSDAKILIAGQAPGRRVHATGIPFDDPSGDRLRDWMGVTREQFYNPQLFAIVPMGFCYPGTGNSGDLPPRPECAATWRARLLRQLPRIETTLVIGKYAHDYHFGKSNLTVTRLVENWQQHWPRRLPLPHPSPRNNIWLKKNPWFETKVVPVIRARITHLLKT